MSQILPEALLDAIDDLGKLPGVGSRTAERYTYYLLKNDPLVAQKIAHSLTNLHNNVKSCPITFALISKSRCLGAENGQSLQICPFFVAWQ